MKPFMNDYDIQRARSRFTHANCPNRLGLAIMVDRLAQWTDENSDGWAFWAKPRNSASRAIGLIASTTYAANQQQESQDCSDEEVAAAIRPVKAFLTRMAKQTNRHGRPLVSAEQREQILRSVS